MKVWVFVLILGLVLIGYSFLFSYYQGKFLELMKEKNGSAFKSVTSILERLDSLPLMDTSYWEALIAFNQGLWLVNDSQTKSIKFLTQATKTSNSQLASKAHFNLGNLYVLGGNYQKALQEYQLAIEKDPSNLSAKYNWELLMRKLRKRKKTASSRKSSGKKKKKNKKSLIKIPGKGGGNQKGEGW